VELHDDDLRLDLPASNKYLSVLGANLDAFIERIEGVAEPRVAAYNIQLAVNEICANIIAHAYRGAPGGRVVVTARLLAHPRRLLVELADTGAPFDPSQVAEPDLEGVQIHGYGLFLTRSLMDDVAYERRPEGNLWRLIKHL
jgi:serine/threonine-protein kinase RsbW